MLWNASHLAGYVIEANDGSIGAVEDMLFDDTDWKVRWLVVDTGTILHGQRVLLPPDAARFPDPGRRAIAVNLTRRQVRDSPPLEADLPVSRQREHEIYDHYGWTPYWTRHAAMPIAGGAAVVPPAAVGAPPLVRGDLGLKRLDHADEAPGDPHLRSVNEITGYYIEASDGNIGHVEDLLVDAQDWTIRYVIVDTINWWPGKAVLIAPQAITRIDWTNGQLVASLSQDQIRESPPFDPRRTVDREYEEKYHTYYGYPFYW